MKKVLDVATKELFDPERAEELAKNLRESDTYWNYVAKHDPQGTGKSFIECYDEDGLFVGCV